MPGTEDAEFAIVVTDKVQHQGLGTQYLRRLVEIGRTEGVRRIVADILPENRDMQELCEKLGFDVRYSSDDQVEKAELSL